MQECSLKVLLFLTIIYLFLIIHVAPFHLQSFSATCKKDSTTVLSNVSRRNSNSTIGSKTCISCTRIYSIRVRRDWIDRLFLKVKCRFEIFLNKQGSAIFTDSTLCIGRIIWFWVQFGINLHEWVFQKAEIAWAASSSAN